MNSTNDTSAPTIKKDKRTNEVRVRLTEQERSLLDRLHEDYGLTRSDVLRSTLVMLEGYITTSQGRHGDYDRLLVTAVKTGHPLAVQRLIDAHSSEFWQCMSEGIHPYSDETLRREE